MMTIAAATADTPKLFPIRSRTGTAAFHLSTEAVDWSYEDIDAMTPVDAVMFMAQVRWGSTTEMPCPHCNTVARHYWTINQRRWKCACCGKRFSVTSGTVFADRKLPLTKILKIIFSWANGASGKPALQLRRDWKVSYPTVFTLLHKLREGLLRGFNTGMLCGVHEMDGMDINGRRHREKRNRPQGGGTKKDGPKIPTHLLKPRVPPEGAEVQGPPVPPKFDKKKRQPADRRILLVMRQRGVAKKQGGVATRIAVALQETKQSVTAMATRFASTESHIMSDEDPSYAAFERLFAEHRTVCHSKEFSTPEGTNNNLAESFNWRMRRGAEGIYLSPSCKYIADYAAEMAWREDARRMSTGTRLKGLLSTVLQVGLSLWWRGYTHGRHRTYEFLVEGDQPAKGRGRPKGAKPKTPR